MHVLIPQILHNTFLIHMLANMTLTIKQSASKGTLSPPWDDSHVFSKLQERSQKLQRLLELFMAEGTDNSSTEEEESFKEDAQDFLENSNAHDICGLGRDISEIK